MKFKKFKRSVMLTKVELTYAIMDSQEKVIDAKKEIWRTADVEKLKYDIECEVKNGTVVWAKVKELGVETKTVEGLISDLYESELLGEAKNEKDN